MSQHLENLDGESPTSAITTFDVIKAKPADHLKTLAHATRDAHVRPPFIEHHDADLKRVAKGELDLFICDGRSFGFRTDEWTKWYEGEYD